MSEELKTIASAMGHECLVVLGISRDGNSAGGVFCTGDLDEQEKFSKEVANSMADWCDRIKENAAAANAAAAAKAKQVFLDNQFQFAMKASSAAAELWKEYSQSDPVETLRGLMWKNGVRLSRTELEGRLDSACKMTGTKDRNKIAKQLLETLFPKKEATATDE